MERGLFPAPFLFYAFYYSFNNNLIQTVQFLACLEIH